MAQPYEGTSFPRERLLRRLSIGKGNEFPVLARRRTLEELLSNVVFHRVIKRRLSPALEHSPSAFANELVEDKTRLVLRLLIG